MWCALGIVGLCCSREDIAILVNSRYIVSNVISFSNLKYTFKSISLLWNLQTITIDNYGWSRTPIILPDEIWEMPQLRHLKMEQGVFNLPDPPSTNGKNGRGDIIVLKNLQTLYNIMNFRCTDEVVNRIPNLKKLGICYFVLDDDHKIYNLSNLHNLESLVFHGGVENMLRDLYFPRSLKKLTLESWWGVCWEDLTVVGSLPHLEVLRLIRIVVEGREWKPVEGEFLQLKSLRIERSNLEDWIADRSHFPSLEKLELGFLKHLKEIPSGIGEIPTLGSISLVRCSDSANSSARKIQEEQQDLGNDDLQLKIK